MSKTPMMIHIDVELREALLRQAGLDGRSLSSYCGEVLREHMVPVGGDYRATVVYDERTEVLPPDPKPVRKKAPPEGVVYDPDTRKWVELRKVVVGEPTEAQAAFRRQMLAKGK